MNTSTARSSRHHRHRFLIETLEPRRLLSGTWSTVDTIPTQSGAWVNGMTADKAGKVYAVGEDGDNGTLVLREKPAGSAQWTTMATVNSGSYGEFRGVAVDAAGDVFITGRTNSEYFTTWELPAGTTTLKQIDVDSAGAGLGDAVTIDGSGNVYSVGGVVTYFKRSTYSTWTVRKGTLANGKWSFTTVDSQLTQSKNGPHGVTVAPTGIYVAGTYNGNWTIRKSPTGASGTWTTVDSLSGGNSNPAGIATDAAGNVYAAGYSSHHWTVRESTNGGSSWTTVDDFIGTFSTYATAIARDASGNMVVAGWTYDNTGDEIAMVRTNAGGSWRTLDSYGYPAGNAYYSAVAADSVGNLYAGGEMFDNAGTVDNWMIRSQPAAPTGLIATTLSASEVNLSWTNAAGADATGFEIFRSTDGVNFSAIGTTDANTTIFGDNSLSAGTTYYYYVVTLLNSDGSSNASNTASAST
jgi:hypothetical protein